MKWNKFMNEEDTFNFHNKYTLLECLSMRNDSFDNDHTYKVVRKAYVCSK